ncbi:MAG TPA: NUDIX domain-containing protein [Bacteroidia bacterium]|nr:NUDIX domain-containing protein [Bacteroidia bacterium]
MEFYKIYYKDKKVIIANETDINYKGNNTLFASYDNIEILQDLIKVLLNVPSIETLYIYGDNPEQIWVAYKSLYTIIEAAGGLVLNKASHALLIFRLGKWDLPKGKIEKNESIQEAAIREVIEECGVKQLHIESKLIDTYHIYQLKGKQILKVSHWFLMRCNDAELDLIPQTIEGITDAKWMTVTDSLNVLDNCYSSVKDVLTKFFIKPL